MGKILRIGKIDVVGVPYTLWLYRDEYKKLNEHARERDERYLMGKDDRTLLDGYCDYQAKEIRVFCDEFTSKDYFEATLRHEICHAFLYEVGYSHHDDEEFIDKLSRWIPQINKIFDFSIASIKLKEIVKKQIEKGDEE
jgi:hypothetical protein